MKLRRIGILGLSLALGAFLLAGCDWAPPSADTQAPASLAATGAPGQASMEMKGSLAIKKIPAKRSELPAAGFYAEGLPPDLPLSAWLRTVWEESTLRARVTALGLYRGITKGEGVVATARVYGTKVHRDGRIEHLGLMATRLVTTAGVNYLRDDFANAAGAADITLFKFHGMGTGTTAEAVGDTALVTESTTALNPDSTRATGTQDNAVSKRYRSVGTLTFDATAAITEHGIFTTSATGTGTLWDRSVFAAINVASGDSIQTTYDLTISDGG